MNSAASFWSWLLLEIDQNIAGLSYIPAVGDSPGQRSSLRSRPELLLSEGSSLVHQKPSPARWVAVSDWSMPAFSASTVIDAGGSAPESRAATMWFHQSTSVWRLNPTSPSALNSDSPRW